jgi:hypothetical protein
MGVMRDMAKLMALAWLVAFDLVRPSRPEFRLPARWTAP